MQYQVRKGRRHCLRPDGWCKARRKAGWAPFKRVGRPRTHQCFYASSQSFGVLTVVAVAHPSLLARIVLALSAILLAADAFSLLVTVGPFIGEALLAVSIATYAAGAFLLRPET